MTQVIYRCQESDTTNWYSAEYSPDGDRYAICDTCGQPIRLYYRDERSYLWKHDRVVNR